MTAETVKVKNKLATPLSLHNVEGDTIQLPVGNNWHNVPRSYIEFQAPSIGVAEIEGYDYATGSFFDAPPAPAPAVETAPVEEVAPETETVTNAALLLNNSNQTQRPNGSNNGNNRPNNPQR